MTIDCKRIARSALLGVAVLALAACASPHRRHDGMDHGKMMKSPMAHAQYQPASGQGAAGRVMFHELDGPRLYLHAKLAGLPPGAPLSLTLRDGDCGAGSAHAGHEGHGAASTAPAPALPALSSDAQGAADAKRVIDGAGLSGVTGRALLLGAADGRLLACAVVASGHHGSH